MPKKRNTKQYRLLFFFIGFFCGAVVMFLVLFMENGELRLQKKAVNSKDLSYGIRRKEISSQKKNREQQQKKSDLRMAADHIEDSSHATFIGHGAFAAETGAEVVASDRLLFTRTIAFPSKENQEGDTLHKSFPGAVSQKLKVEFWQSPMNSVGYQMYPNRLVLFGFYDSTKVHIIFQENYFKLIYDQDTYSIVPSDQYEPIYLK